MRAIILLLSIVSLGAVRADDKDAIIELTEIPAPKPFDLPPVPKLDFLEGERDSPNSNDPAEDKLQAAPKGSPVSFSQNTLFYTRQKQGNGFIKLIAERDSFVKIVDWDTKRLEAYLWVKKGTTYNHQNAPDSFYMIFFVQDAVEMPDGELVGTWFGKTSEPFFAGDSKRITIELGALSKTHRILISDLSDFLRFSPPK